MRPLTPGTATLSGGVEGITAGDAPAAFTDANAFATNADFFGHDQLGRRQYDELHQRRRGRWQWRRRLYGRTARTSMRKRGPDKRQRSRSTTRAAAQTIDTVLNDGCGCAADGVDNDGGRRRRGHDAGDAERGLPRRQCWSPNQRRLRARSIGATAPSVTTFSSAAITQPGGVGTPFIVNGTHIYAEEGPDQPRQRSTMLAAVRRLRPDQRRLRMRR